MAVCILSGVVIVLVLALLVLMFHIRIEKLSTCVEDGLAIGITELKSAATQVIKNTQADIRHMEAQAFAELKQEIDAAQERSAELEEKFEARIGALEAKAGL